MAKLRSLNTEIWSDTWFENLNPTEKLLFIYLITNNKTNMLGIYEASIKRISFDTGIEKEMVSKALEGFERVKKVKYKENHIILINYLKHQNYNPNMMKSAIETFNNLPKQFEYEHINIEKGSTKETVLNCFVTLSKRLGMVRKVEVEVEVEVLEKEKPKKTKKVFSEEVLKCFENCLLYFPKELHPKKRDSWLDTIEKLNRIDKYQFSEIEHIVESARSDDFWEKHFFSILKLRKLNPDNIKYIVVFQQKFKLINTPKYKYSGNR
ncbi:MAG: hypothetical protein QM499_00830 [Flavobacteriaceae bacterium]